MSPITLNDFSRLAGQAAAADQDATFLKVSDGELSRTGSVGNFFTTQATQRETLDAFVGALRAEYGDHVADMVNNTAIGAMREAGKPLTARLVQDLTSLAKAEQTRVNAHNQGVVDAFLNGPGLDEALGALYTSASPADRAVLKERVQNFLTDKAAQGGFHSTILTADALKTNVGYGFPSFTGLSSSRHKDALLPNQPGTLQDRLRLADMGLGAKSAIAFQRSVTDLPAMRAMQPEGELTPETLYRTLFKQAPPAGLGGRDLTAAIETRCEQDKTALLARAAVTNPLVTEDYLSEAITALPWDRIVSLTERPATITRDDAAALTAGTWSGRMATQYNMALHALCGDPGRAGTTDPANLPPPTLTFHGLADGKGGTKTESVMEGRATNFFTNKYDAKEAALAEEKVALAEEKAVIEADRAAIETDPTASDAVKAARIEANEVKSKANEAASEANEAASKAIKQDKLNFRQGAHNSMTDHLLACSREICGGENASEAQVTGVISCLNQTALLPLRHLAALAGTHFTEHANVSVSLTRQPDGSVRADYASPEEMRDTRGHFSMSLTIGKDGAMTMTEFELTPPLAIRQQRENEAVAQARAARIGQTLTTAAPFRAMDDSPDGLFAQIRGRALALDPEARLEPMIWADMDSEVGKRLTTMARESAQPLTQEQILTVRADVLNEFFDRLGEAAALVPQEQRGVFTRGCLELGSAPDPALLPAMAQMAGSVTNVLGAILDAKDANEVRQLLSGLELSMRSATTLNPDFAGRGPDFFTPAHLLAMRMGTLNLMGKDNPQAFAQALTRPGPFRDALHSVGSEPTEENGHIQQALNWFNGGMTRILPDETLMETLNPHEVRECDLSLPRQREILGEGVYAARGAEDAPDLAGLNQSLRREMPAIREHIRDDAETDLRLGPGTGKRASSGLSEQFAKDYPRGGIFVDGRYYNPLPSTNRVGTGTSEQDFIDLFPDAHTAGALSNLAAQNLHGIFQNALALAAPESREMIFQGVLSTNDMATPPSAQNMRIDTLDADQGRYRLTASLVITSRNPDSAIESFRYEVAVDVNLGAPVTGEGPRLQPTVEDVRTDVLLRGREAVPGEA